jgi:hypothetical protein
VSDADAFQADLIALGFRPVQNRLGTIQFALEATPYLTYWVHWDTGDGTVLFTWEHALAAFFDALEMQVGANEELNQFLYPKHDARGTQDVQFVLQEMDRVEQLLRSANLLSG